MSVDGNITTLVVTEAELVARAPGLPAYRSKTQADWAAQLTAGQVDALAAFRAAKSHDPLRAKALHDNDWKRVLTFFTLSVICSGFTPATQQWQDEAERWRAEAIDALKDFLYRYDENDTGSLDEDDADEEPQRIREVVLRR